ncbi:hypothetical protein HYX02_02825 [Candidatus Woesearchaeota archaeon]|nr:hypothetical protein [Candidatus Woesearchaeota archaeon]
MNKRKSLGLLVGAAAGVLAGGAIAHASEQMPPPSPPTNPEKRYPSEYLGVMLERGVPDRFPSSVSWHPLDRNLALARALPQREPSQVAAQPAPVSPTPAPTTSRKKPIVRVKKSPTKQTYRWVFNQAEQEHKNFIAGKVKYASLPDAVRAWFSLRHPKFELSETNGKYAIKVTPITKYKGKDLVDFVGAIKIGSGKDGKWYYSLPLNVTSTINLTQEEYDAIKASKNPIAQLMFYKLENNGATARVYASLNYERDPSGIPKPKKKAGLEMVIASPDGERVYVVNNGSKSSAILVGSSPQDGVKVYRGLHPLADVLREGGSLEQLASSLQIYNSTAARLTTETAPPQAGAVANDNGNIQQIAYGNGSQAGNGKRATASPLLTQEVAALNSKPSSESIAQKIETNGMKLPTDPILRKAYLKTMAYYMQKS